MTAHDPPQRIKHFAVPLVVDIDGSLVNGNLLIEGVFRLLAVSPFSLFVLPFWLMKGRAALKRRIARAVPLPPATLVLNPAVLNEIAAAQTAGREVWLASASDELVVAPLAESVGAVGYLASDGRTNLAGQTKAAALVERFGEGGFDYVGNERRDLVVWKHARGIIGVGLSTGLARKVRDLDDTVRFISGFGGRPLDYLLALRPHQWIKNVLVFVPPIAAHETDPGLYVVAAGMFVAFSACASGTYLFNDLIDLPHDRGHESKRHRPLAAGTVPVSSAIGIGAALMVLGLALVFRLSAEAGLYVLLYLVLTFAYSLSLKRKTFIDVITLATFYAVRVLVGAVAVAVPLSSWFMAFCLFMFLALAIVKRQSELRGLRETDCSAISGRNYSVDDRSTLTALAAASSVASVVVFTLYVQSPKVMALYARPELLWLVCPLLLYWLGRVTLLANRGVVADPLIFAMRDRTSWLIGLSTFAAFVVAL